VLDMPRFGKVINREGVIFDGEEPAQAIEAGSAEPVPVSAEGERASLAEDALATHPEAQS
jgi:hypothetical protein